MFSTPQQNEVSHHSPFSHNRTTSARDHVIQVIGCNSEVTSTTSTNGKYFRRLQRIDDHRSYLQPTPKREDSRDLSMIEIPELSQICNTSNTSPRKSDLKIKQTYMDKDNYCNRFNFEKKSSHNPHLDQIVRIRSSFAPRTPECGYSISFFTSFVQKYRIVAHKKQMYRILHHDELPLLPQLESPRKYDPIYDLKDKGKGLSWIQRSQNINFKMQNRRHCSVDPLYG